MGFTKVNISIPTEIEEKLSQLVPKGKKSSFIVDCVKEKIQQMERETLLQALKEGYSAQCEDLELWNQLTGDGIGEY